MNINQLLEAGLWAAGSSVASIIFSLVILRLVFGLTINKIVQEVEEDQNMAVAIIFAFFSIMVSFFVASFATDGFTSPGNTVQDASWLVLGFAAAAVMSTVVNSVILRTFGNRLENESVFAYLQREFIVENNGALALFVTSQGAVWFIQAYFQVI